MEVNTFVTHATAQPQVMSQLDTSKEERSKELMMKKKILTKQPINEKKQIQSNKILKELKIKKQGVSKHNIKKLQGSDECYNKKNLRQQPRSQTSVPKNSHLQSATARPQVTRELDELLDMYTITRKGGSNLSRQQLKSMYEIIKNDKLNINNNHKSVSLNQYLKYINNKGVQGQVLSEEDKLFFLDFKIDALKLINLQEQQAQQR